MFSAFKLGAHWFDQVSFNTIMVIKKGNNGADDVALVNYNCADLSTAGQVIAGEK